jgi:hypothetical protein
MSKKYKLIKAYPGSPKLGAIVSSTSKYCEGHPEFWEEVIGQDYEIISISTNSFAGISHSKVDIKAFEEGVTPEWNIHSVKRLSDGTVFTVGDKVNFLSHDTVLEHICLNKQKQLCFKIKGCYAVLENVFSNNNFKHASKPLFTTEDGVDIYLMKEYWCVYSNFSYQNFRAYSDSGKDKSCKYFSTEAAAVTYIMFNKPCLSIKEICPVIGRNNHTTHIDLNNLTCDLLDLVKSKS